MVEWRKMRIWIGVKRKSQKGRDLQSGIEKAEESLLSQIDRIGLDWIGIFDSG